MYCKIYAMFRLVFRVITKTKAQIHKKKTNEYLSYVHSNVAETTNIKYAHIIMIDTIVHLHIHFIKILTINHNIAMPYSIWSTVYWVMFFKTTMLLQKGDQFYKKKNKHFLYTTRLDPNDPVIVVKLLKLIFEKYYLHMNNLSSKCCSKYHMTNKWYKHI